MKRPDWRSLAVLGASGLRLHTCHTARDGGHGAAREQCGSVPT